MHVFIAASIIVHTVLFVYTRPAHTFFRAGRQL